MKEMENNQEVIQDDQLEVAEVVDSESDNKKDTHLSDPEGKNECIRFISSVAPLGITEKPSRSPEDTPVVVILFLCKDTDDKFFIIKRLVMLESKDDIQMILDNQLFDSNNFINSKAVSGMLLSSLDSYYSDLDFDVDDKTYSYDEKPIVTCEVFDQNNNLVKIGMNLEQFGAMAYIETYTFGGINNAHDLTVACVTGSGVLEHEQTGKDNSFFLVEDIEEIVSMAPANSTKKKGLFNKKNSSTVGLVLKLSRSIENDGRLVKEYVYTLLPLDVEKVYDKKKFKGETIDNITDKFYGEADQYISTYIVGDMRFISIDKQFMMFRGKSKNNDKYMFLLDSSLCNKLQRLIEAY